MLCFFVLAALSLRSATKLRLASINGPDFWIVVVDKKQKIASYSSE